MRCFSLSDAKEQSKVPTAVNTVTVSQPGTSLQLEDCCLQKFGLGTPFIYVYKKKKKKPQPNASFAHLCHIRHLHKLGPCLHIIMAACRFVASTFTDHLSRFGSQRKVCLPVFLRSSLSLDIWLINWIHFKSLRSRFIKCSFWKVYLLWTFFGYLICQSLSTFSSSLH